MTSKEMDFSRFPQLREKCEQMGRGLESCRSIGVAFSGGVDSGFLAWFLQNMLSRKVHALIALSPLLSVRERRMARKFAGQMELNLHEVQVNPLLLEEVRTNSPKRCYFCKRAIMQALRDRALELECDVLVEGSHAGDFEIHRPGHSALKELGIESPLAQGGLTKDEIRMLARSAGLSHWNRPSQSCLATRVPYGVELSHDLLKTIEEAENILWEAGCRQVRVRLHGPLARIEVDPQDMVLFLDDKFRKEILASYGRLGFLHVALDLAGFHSGSMDKEVKNSSGRARNLGDADNAR